MNTANASETDKDRDNANFIPSARDYSWLFVGWGILGVIATVGLIAKYLF